MKRPGLKNVVFVITIVLAILAVVTLFVNKGFFFSENHSQVQVSLKGDGTGPSQVTLTNILNDIGKDPLVSKVDRKNDELFFQNSNLTDVTLKFKDRLTDGVTATYAEQISFDQTETTLLKNYLIEIALLGIFSFAGLFLFAWRFNESIKFKQYREFFTIYAGSIILGLVLQLGLMSAVSRFYEINYLDLLSLQAFGVFLSVLFFFAAYHYKTKEGVSFISIADTIEDEARKHAALWLRVAFVILIIVSIALSTNFVMSAVFMFTSLLISFVSLFVVSYSMVLLGKVNTSNLRNLRNIRNLRIKSNVNKLKEAKKSGSQEDKKVTQKSKTLKIVPTKDMVEKKPKKVKKESKADKEKRLKPNERKILKKKEERKKKRK